MQPTEIERYGGTIELLDDRSDSPLICQQIADELPGVWWAYCYEGADARERFLLHSPQIPFSEISAHPDGYGPECSHWEWSISALWPKDLNTIPGVFRNRPFERTKCRTAKSRTPASIAADLQRRLLPAGEQFWDRCRGYLETQREGWAAYLDAIAEVCEMAGKPAPDFANYKGGPFGADYYEVTHGVWRVKISRYGLTYKLSRTGDVSEDLFDQLDAIEWGSGDA